VRGLGRVLAYLHAGMTDERVAWRHPSLLPACHAGVTDRLRRRIDPSHLHAPTVQLERPRWPSKERSRLFGQWRWTGSREVTVVWLLVGDGGSGSGCGGELVHLL
jgi:hypothetical protein